jgi:hypothetical protein
MSDIFQAKRGTVVRSSTSQGAGLVSLGGLDSSTLLMLTDVQANRNQITQYIKTLDTANYGYAWGEGPGSIRVSGLIFFMDGCEPSGQGAEIINSYYDQNNVYTADGNEQVLTIGGASFRGYLEKLQIGAEQNEYNFGTFSLEFTILPKS